MSLQPKIVVVLSHGSRATNGLRDTFDTLSGMSRKCVADYDRQAREKIRDDVADKA